MNKINKDIIRCTELFKAEYPGFNWKSAYFFVLAANVKRSLNPVMNFHYIYKKIK